MIGVLAWATGSRTDAEPPGRPSVGAMGPGELAGSGDSVGSPRRTALGWAVDVSTFILAILLGTLLFFLQADVETAPDWLVLADVGAGVLLCVALWGRRRWPVPLAVLAAVLTTFSAMGGAAASVLLFTVAVHRRASLALGIAVLHLAAGLAFIWIRPDPGLAVWVQVVMTILIVAAAVAWGMYVRARRELLDSLRERARRAESEQQLRIEQARYLERARIAREMHDVLAHRISLVSLHAGALEFRTDAAPEDVTRSAAVIRSSAHQALQDLREILGVLRSDGDQEATPAPQPTLADVVRLVEESRQAGLWVSLDCAVADVADVPASIGRTCYRVVQEGLTNARKHSPGLETTVLVSGGLGLGLEVEVRSRWPSRAVVTPVAERPVGAVMDAAIGAPIGAVVRAPIGAEVDAAAEGAAVAAGGQAAVDGAIPGAGQGLTGLRERTTLAGGRLEHGKTPTGDFQLAAWLPWPV
jgi:signal transduction histidine kinase